MPNPLTGDFQAILEISGSTLNRLMASMHQNSGFVTSLPTLPQSAFLQLGKVDGVSGSVRGQVSVPLLELIDGSRDRIFLTTCIRAQFRADPGSSAFPVFIYGVVRAEYAVDQFRNPDDPRVVFLRIEVVPDTVSFTSIGPDTSWDAAITRQIVFLLSHEFRMTPHPLLTEFQQGRLKSLVRPSAAAVAAALDLPGGGTGGNLNSVQEIFLGGRDFAVAISREFVLSLIQPTLNALKASHPTFSVTIKTFWGQTISGTYQVDFTQATAQWAPGTMMLSGASVPAGVITLKIAGSATTPSIFPNATFTVDHSLWLGFVPASESLVLVSAGPPSVSASVNGPFGFFLNGHVKNAVSAEYNSQLNAALKAAQPMLQAVSDRKQDLIWQLRSIDDQANAHFEAAEFTNDGMVLRGRIDLSPRWIPRVNFGPLADLKGFTGFVCWIPGGRIDWFDWRWTWFSSASSGPYGPLPLVVNTKSYEDRFVLQPGVSLPGLPPVDGDPGYSWPRTPGSVCLSIRGVQLNAVTGAEEPIDTSVAHREPDCNRYFPQPTLPPPPSGGPVGWHKPRLWAKIWLLESEPADPATRELAVLDLSAGPDAIPSCNTLVHYVDNPAAAPMIGLLVDALKRANRDDPDVFIVVVFREGLLAAGGPDLGAQLSSFAEKGNAPLVVTEDIAGGWSKVFELPTGHGVSATRLITPDGRVAWAHDGPLNEDTVLSAMIDHLRAGELPHAAAVATSLKVGEPMPDFEVNLAAGDATRFSRLRDGEAIICFIQKWATPCIAQLRRLQRIQDSLRQQNLLVLALVGDADFAAIESLVKEYGLTFPVALDRQEAIAGRFGVRAWPTTILLNAAGIVSSVQVGTTRGALQARAREQFGRAMADV
jgi:peroxiredoxin